MDKIPNKEEIIDYCRKLNLNIVKKTVDNLNPDSTVQLWNQHSSNNSRIIKNIKKIF